MKINCSQLHPCVLNLPTLQPLQVGHLPTKPHILHITGDSIFSFSLWNPTATLLPGKPHGQRSLVSCSPWGHYESDTTERLHFHFSLSCTGEGNGNPLQCSCLEDPRDGRAWWAAVYGVAQSRTQLKRLSSSSESKLYALHLTSEPSLFISIPQTPCLKM